MAEIGLLVRATIVLGLCLGCLRLTREASASLRAFVIVAAFGGLAAMPILSNVLPPLLVAVPSVRMTTSPNSVPLVGEVNALGAVSQPGEAPAQTSSGSFLSLRVALRSMWSAGVIACLVPLALGCWRLSRLRRVAVPWPRCQELARDLAHKSSAREPRVLLHDQPFGPITCGLSRPVVLMPLDAQTWCDAEIRRAIAHELEHIRRADWPVQIAVRIVCALYWCHPLAWIAWRQLRLESERACDDAVVRESDPREYAAQLVRLARQLSAHRPVAVLSMASRSDLSRRVEALLDSDQARGRIMSSTRVATIVLAMLCMFVVAPLKAVQRAAPARDDGQRIAFEVASVKPSPADERGRVFHVDPTSGRLRASNQTLKTLIALAYGEPFPLPLPEDRLSGGPEWLDKDRFTIEAKAAEDALRVDGVRRMGLMLRTLLNERFKLVAAMEARPASVYALVLARRDRRLGPKLREAENCGDQGRHGIGGRPGLSQLQCATMAEFAWSLSEFVGRPVVDDTGLSGNYEATVEWSPAEEELHAFGERADGAQSPEATGPSIFSALQEQLGLKLESRQGTAQHLVVRGVEKPAAN